MSKLKKHPKFQFHKIKDFDKILPDKEIHQVLNDELPYLYKNLKNPKSKIAKHIKKYFIIRLVTIVESHLKYLTAHLIDYHNIKANSLFVDGVISLQIRDIERINDSKFTMGKMAATMFNFQNMQEADLVFSHLLGIKFFDSLEEYAQIGVKNDSLDKEEIEHYQKYKKDFFAMFELRHEIIHSMKTPHKIRRKPEYFDGLWEGTLHFLRLVFSLAESVVKFKEGEAEDEDLQIFFSKKTKQFKK